MRARSRSHRDLAAATAGSVATSLAVFLTGTLAVQLRPALHLSLDQLGLAAGIYYLAAAIGSVPFGHLTENVGGARVMRGAAAGATAAMVLLALLARSFLTLSVLLGVSGLFASAMQPATNLFLVRRIVPNHQGLAFGVKQAAVPASAMLAGLAVPAIALSVGWRWAFVVAAVVAAIATVLIPRPLTTLRERRAARHMRREPLAMRALLVLTAGFAFGVFSATAMTTFLVSSLVATGTGKAAAGLVAALAGTAALGSRVLLGAIADRRGDGHFRMVAGMLAFGVIGYLALAVGSAINMSGMAVLGAVLAYGSGWGWNGLFNFAIARSHPEAPAQASAITHTGNRLASVVAPIMFGFVVGHASYAVGWAMIAGVALLATVVTLIGSHLLVPSTRRGIPRGPTAFSPVPPPDA